MRRNILIVFIVMMSTVSFNSFKPSDDLHAEDGNLWVALWGSGTVGKFNPQTGELLQKVIVPAPNVSSCAFRGKNLEILYITTARVGVNDAKLKGFPLSGGLFSVKPGVRGVPAEFYKGKL